MSRLFASNVKGVCMGPVFQELLEGEVGPQAFREIPKDVVLFWVDHIRVYNASLVLSPEVLFGLEEETYY